MDGTESPAHPSGQPVWGLDVDLCASGEPLFPRSLYRPDTSPLAFLNRFLSQVIESPSVSVVACTVLFMDGGMGRPSGPAGESDASAADSADAASAARLAREARDA